MIFFHLFSVISTSGMRCFTWGTKSLWVSGLLTASCKNDSSWYALTRTRAISFQGWWEECCKMQAIVSMPRTSTSYITWDLSTWASLVDWQRQKSTIFVRGATSYWARILRTVSCFQTICMYIYICVCVFWLLGLCFSGADVNVRHGVHVLSNPGGWRCHEWTTRRAKEMG